MIEINQELLCEFCKDHHDSDMNMCEGSECEKIAAMYLEDKGITEDNPEEKTFAKLCVNDKIYRLIEKRELPRIEQHTINSITAMNNDPMRVNYGSDSFNVPEDKAHSNTTENFFLVKKDAKKRLDEVCTARIIALSKIIGAE